MDKHGFLTTSQIRRIHNLGGSRNTLRILSDMKHMLSSFRENETVWYLNQAGRKEIGSDTVRKRNNQTQHILARNDVYIAYKPDYWRQELPIKWADKTIVPDAVFRANGHFSGQYVFLEADLTQSMAQNERKIELYRELRETQLFQRKYGHFPVLLFVTTTDPRRTKLRALVGDLKAEVLTFNDIN